MKWIVVCSLFTLLCYYGINGQRFPQRQRQPNPRPVPRPDPRSRFGPTGQDFRSPQQNFGPPGQNFGPPGQNFGPPGQNFNPANQNFRQPGQNFRQNGQNFGQNFGQNRQGVANNIRAFFSMAGVAGDIEFSDSGFNNTRATISITASQWYQWEVREFPVLTTDKDACDDASLGRTIKDLTEFQSVIDGRTRQGTRVELRGVSLTEGPNAILGRSILLKNNDQRACATIQGAEPLSFAVVKGPISGNIQIRKVGRQYAVFTDLFNTRTLPQRQSTLRMYRGSVNVDLPGAQRRNVDVSHRCSFVSNINMVAEIRNLPIATPGGRKQRFMAHILPSGQNFDFSSGWLKIGESTVTSCANIHKYEPKTVQAVFSREGVNGLMVFRQENPYKPTTLQVDLQNLNSQASGYHIHMFPLPYEYSARENLCGPDVTAGHYNPFFKQAIRGGLRNTQEDYEIGDLSNKHGTLANRRDINQTFTDLYLPLFGQYSIVGRSVVIHTPTGARWICANIGYPGPMTVAKAEFNGDVEGTITFVQEENKPWTDTTVFVEMMASGKTSQSTFNHNYHIHTNPVKNDHLTDTRRCASTGGHFNPFSAPVTDARMYRQTCSSTNRLGCEVGDLSNKYNETINMAAGPSSSKYLYTDDIALSGAYSVIKRSITIHQQQRAAARYVCADIIKKLTPVITTDHRWYGQGTPNTNTGKIQMSSLGLNSHATSIVVALDGLNRKAREYQIHELPLNTLQPGNNVCDTAGGHYNPLRVQKGRQADSLDRHEIGDLSSKFQTLQNRESYRLQTVDTNLPLSGAYSVAGRSVVIYDSTSQRWKCANTVWDTRAMNGTLLQARATFQGEIQGYIAMSQVVSIDGESDVNIEMMLWYTNRQQPSRNHNWHVHQSSIVNKNCATTGGHYNPFRKDTRSATYRTCNPQSPRKCEVGDMSGKFGRIDIGTKANPTRYVFNDNFLTLSGAFSVMGRSIVIHSDSQGAQRVACADLTPSGLSTQVVQIFLRNDIDSNPSKVQDALRTDLRADPANNVFVKAGAQRGPCTSMSIHFTGAKAEELKQRFNQGGLIDKYRSNTRTCNGAGQAYLSGLLLLLLMAVVAH